MKFSNTLRFGFAALAAVGTLALGTPGVQAQPPGGNFQMPPEIKAKIAAWQKYRDSHKNLVNLQTMLMQVREIDKDPATSLDKKQSAKMLGVWKAWRNKPSMSEDQAKAVSKQISSTLTEKQLKKMSTIQPFRRGMGGGGPGRGPGGPGGPGGGGRPAGGPGRGPGGPGRGPGGPGGAGGFPDPPKGSYNPLNPDTLPFERMRPEAKKATDEFIANLQRKAK